MTKREVMLAIQAFQDFCGLMDRVKEAALRCQAMGALNLTEIMQEAQQAWGGDYEQCAELP